MLVRAWRWYQRCLALHPVKTQVISSGILWGIGDVAAQSITRSFTPPPADKVASFFLFLMLFSFFFFLSSQCLEMVVGILDGKWDSLFFMILCADSESVVWEIFDVLISGSAVISMINLIPYFSCMIFFCFLSIYSCLIQKSLVIYDDLMIDGSYEEI